MLLRIKLKAECNQLSSISTTLIHTLEDLIALIKILFQKVTDSKNKRNQGQVPRIIIYHQSALYLLKIITYITENLHVEDPNLNKFLISATKLHASPLNMEFMVIPGK